MHRTDGFDEYNVLYPYSSRRNASRRQHPIITLPGELLALVFSLGTEEDPMLPVAVSHVCTAWRALALHTPSLWRHVVLDERLDMWTERIRRAKACTLDVVLRHRFQSTPYATRQWLQFHGQQDMHSQTRFIDARDVQKYMFCVMPYISRWRSLEIRFDGYMPLLWNGALSTCCIRSPSMHANALRELALVFPNNDDPTKFTTSITQGCSTWNPIVMGAYAIPQSDFP